MPFKQHIILMNDLMTLWLQYKHNILNVGKIRDYLLVGDSGYPCKPWLLTPLLTSNNAAGERYNTAHKRTRATVERCNCVLTRFRYNNPVYVIDTIHLSRFSPTIV